MAKLLALEWDKLEARVVIIRSRSGGIHVEEAFTIDLQQASENPQALSDLEIGQLIRRGLKERKIEQHECLCLTGRANVELNVMTLPPVPEEELPEIVKFQAMRQFSSSTENCELDFVPIYKTDNGQQVTLTAAASHKFVNSVKAVCQAAELNVTHLALRPLSAASLLVANSAFQSDVVILVQLFGEQVDLTVVKDRSVLFTRTTRLHGEPGSTEQTNTLQQEIRRTMIAAQDQLSGSKISKVVILGSQSESQQTVEQLQESLDYAIEILDPFDQPSVQSGLSNDLNDSGKYAALVGMLLDEATSNKHAIDFLDPRKKPEPPDNKRTYTLAAIAASLLLLLMGYYFISQIWGLDQEIGELERKLAKLQKNNKAVAPIQTNIEEIDRWQQNNIVWIDELYRLADKLPTAEEVILSRLDLKAGIREGGTITMDGHVSDQEVITKLEQSLGNDQHKVLGKESKQSDSVEKYFWSFQESITIAGPEEYFSETVSQLNNQSSQDESTSEEAEQPKELEKNDPENFVSASEEKQS